VAEVPYYHASVDWDDLKRKHPPPPLYERTVGRMSDDELRAHQNALFLSCVETAWSTPFFSSRWAAAGLERGDIRSLNDLDKFPIYDSDDVREALDERPPFGSHQPITREELGELPMKLQTSGGTTGLPRVSLFDPVAWEVQAIQGARGMWAQGARPGDIAQIPFTCSLADAPWLAYKMCHDWLGVMPVTTGSGVVTPTERQLELALAFKTNVWVTTVEYAGRLIEVAGEIGFELAQLNTKLIHGYLGNDPSGTRRAAVEEAFGAPMYDAYGSHEIGEIACECTRQNGLHVYEDTVVLEVLEVGGTRPLGFGEKGRLIATSLHRHYAPIIRYDMSDLLELYPRGECECGLVTQKLSHFMGRADEMVKVRGQNVFPRAVEAVVINDDRCTGEYLCVATATGAGTVAATELTVRVERRGSHVEAGGLREDLFVTLRRVLGVRVDVEVVDPGELAPLTGLGGEGKVKRLLDLR
jgi:phenylacetate-CoA ligase